MRGTLVLLAFVLAFVASSYLLLRQQGLLGSDGVELLVHPPRPPAPAREAVVPTPLLTELQQEQAALDAARTELERRQTQAEREMQALQEQRTAMEADIAAVREYREALAQQGAENVQALSQMLANMDEEAAAAIVEKLPTDLAVDVLLLQKERDSGAILEEMDPDTAAVVSERIAQAHLAKS